MTIDRYDELTVRRVVHAPLEAVWRAWTTESGLAAWWWADWNDTTYELDLRVRGKYRIAAPKAGIAVSGEFISIEPPHHLTMTWIWEDDASTGPVERVDVDLSGTDSTTTVTVRHAGPWTTPEPSVNYRQGWNHVLDALADAPAISDANGA